MAHITNVPYIDSTNIDYLMSCLSSSLYTKYGNSLESFNILVVGGSALALKYSYRATVDIDADIAFKHELSSCIQSIASANNIPNDWINQDFIKSSSYSRRLWTNAIYYKTFGFINVYVVSDIDQLCMKMISARPKDVSDALFLCERLIANGVGFNNIDSEFYYLYGDTVHPDQRLLKRVKKIFKQYNLL